MIVGNILEITNPVDINHMIILTTVNSSSLAYWLTFLFDSQCELHHFARVSVQLILDCHLSLPLPGGLLHFLKVSPNLLLKCCSVLLHFLEVSINLYFNGRILLYFLIHSLSLFLQSRIISQDSLDASGRPLIDAELFALLCLHPVIEPGLPHQDLAMRRVAGMFQLPRLDRSSQEPFRAYLERHQVEFALAALYGKVGIGVFPVRQDAVKSIPFTFHLQRSVGGYRMISAISERISCEPGIQSVQFEPPWLFCAFLVSQLEGVHTRITGAPKGGEQTAKWFRCLGSGSEGRSSHPPDPNHHILKGGCNG